MGYFGDVIVDLTQVVSFVGKTGELTLKNGTKICLDTNEYDSDEILIKYEEYFENECM